MPSVRLVLVDDHLLFREGFHAVLASEPDLAVVGEASTTAHALEVIAATRPDLVVLDVSLPDGDGLAVARTLASLRSGVGAGAGGPRVVVLTMHDSTDYVVDALDAGVAGYVLKDQPASEVVEALRAVARGRTYLSPRLPPISPELLGRRGRGGVGADGVRRTRSGPIELLSAREREIFELAVQGCTNQQLADQLGISIKTVETHRMHINRKLGVRSTAELVRLAARRRMLAG